MQKGGWTPLHLLVEVCCRGRDVRRNEADGGILPEPIEGAAYQMLIARICDCPSHFESRAGEGVIGGTGMQLSFNLGWRFGSVGEGMALVGEGDGRWEER